MNKQVKEQPALNEGIHILQINIKSLLSIVSRACLYFQRISKGLWKAGMYFMQKVATHMWRT